MNESQEKKCTNWFMRKSGKLWIYGCSVMVCGLMLGSTVTPALADEAAPTNVSSYLAATQVNQDVSTNQATESAEANDMNSLPETVTNQDSEERTIASAFSDSQEKRTDQKDDIQQPVVKSEDANQNPNNNVTANTDIATLEHESHEQETDNGTITSLSTVANLQEKAEPISQSKTAQLTQLVQDNFKTNLDAAVYDKNVWKYREDGLYSNALGKGDNFFLSNVQGKNFIFQTDVTFLQNTGAASLVFRSNNDLNHLKAYVVNLDGGSHKAKLWRWSEANLIDEREVTPNANNTYQLKVIAADGWLSYYVNGELVANLSDYTLQRSDLGQTTYIPDGYFGLLNWNGEMVFQNTFYKNLKDAELPFIEDVKVSSKNGSVESKGQFFPKGAVYIQYVSNEADTVDLSFTTHNPRAKIYVTDSKGNRYPDYSNIPVNVGANYLTVISEYTTADGYTATLTYRVNIHRRQPKEVYYNENYRDQYHYSVKDGWANDPNGLVYYKGVYHMFYQFYDDTQWGPMHWAHATSTDLIHWKDEPIAFYPDYNGAMFSGSIVVDDKNTSGLFDSPDGGLVALITADGEGQRIKLAYSKDAGKTWTKLDRVVADWSNDPLQSRDFRDPKVFRWNHKWFMVVAGGPLRIYSSDNLLDWFVEATYPDLHT